MPKKNRQVWLPTPGLICICLMSPTKNPPKRRLVSKSPSLLVVSCASASINDKSPAVGCGFTKSLKCLGSPPGWAKSYPDLQGLLSVVDAVCWCMVTSISLYIGTTPPLLTLLSLAHTTGCCLSPGTAFIHLNHTDCLLIITHDPLCNNYNAKVFRSIEQEAEDECQSKILHPPKMNMELNMEVWFKWLFLFTWGWFLGEPMLFFSGEPLEPLPLVQHLHELVSWKQPALHRGDLPHWMPQPEPGRVPLKILILTNP